MLQLYDKSVQVLGGKPRACPVWRRAARGFSESAVGRMISAEFGSRS